MATYKAPGVYIEEQPATGPISGVGTSTAAFIGPALQGPITLPTKITNWTQFKDHFGGYISAPRHYMAYAVEGFFRNGGTVAYIVRAGAAHRAYLDLADRAGGTALRVEARQEGVAGNNITVAVQEAQTLSGAEAVRAEATIASMENHCIELRTPTDAEKFRAGDTIAIGDAAVRTVITRIRDGEIFVEQVPSDISADAKLRIADLGPDQKTFRLSTTTGLQAGSVIRISTGSGKNLVTEDKVVENVAADFVMLSQGLKNTYSMGEKAAVTVESLEFTLVIASPDQMDETFENLSMDPRHSRYFSKVVNSSRVNITLPEEPSSASPPNNRPAAIAATKLAQGKADDLNAITDTHYKAAIEALTRVDDVNMVCAPDRTDAEVQQALIEHCEAMKDRFAILDPMRGALPFGDDSISTQRAGLESQGGYAALYYPQLHIADPQGGNGQTILVPPSGHLAGIYARSDAQRGVHKAPANELINGALKLERRLTEAELGELNDAGVNVIRTFPNSTRPVVWGARTTAPKAETSWRYVNVRRLLLYIEGSIRAGIHWAVFEPNDLALWKKIDRTLNEFLTRVWRAGALFGATPQEAFYIKCDEELNPPVTRALGQLIVEVGVAPVRPAEFVIIRIGQWDGGTAVSES